MKNQNTLFILMLLIFCYDAFYLNKCSSSKDTPQSIEVAISSFNDSIQCLERGVNTLRDSVNNILAKNPGIDVQMQINLIKDKVEFSQKSLSDVKTDLRSDMADWLVILSIIMGLIGVIFGFIIPYLYNRQSAENAELAKQQAKISRLKAEDAQSDASKSSQQVSEAAQQAEKAAQQAEKARGVVTIVNDHATQIQGIKDKVENAAKEAEQAAKKAKATQYFIQALQENDLDRVIGYYDNCIGLDSEFAEAYNNRGYLKYRKGDIKGAKEDFDLAIAKKNNFAEAYNNLGVLLFSIENYDEAEKNFNLAVGYAEAILNLGLLKYAKKDWNGAKENFNQAIEKKRNLADAYYIRGLYNLKLGTQHGFNDILEAKEYKPNVIEDYPNRNLLKWDMKDFDNSIYRVEYSKDYKTLIRVPEDKKGIFLIPGFVNVINDYAFSGCTSIKEIEILESVTTIGKYAFIGCTSIKKIYIPESVTKIGYGAFSGCSGIESFCVIGKNPKYESFCGALYSKNMTKLIRVPYNKVSFEIPFFVTEIGNEAISNCTSLKSIVIPKSITKTGFAPFMGCTKLNEIHLKHTSPVDFTDAFYQIDKTKVILYVPKGSLEEYKNTPYYNNFFDIVGE